MTSEGTTAVLGIDVTLRESPVFHIAGDRRLREVPDLFIYVFI
jgi:hypothetical protein